MERTGEEAGTEDTAAVSDEVTTKFYVRYYTKNAGVYYQRYKGYATDEMVSLNANEFLLLLGKLPVDAKYLNKGVRVYLVLDIVRSLGNDKRTITLKKDFDIL